MFTCNTHQTDGINVVSCHVEFFQTFAEEVLFTVEKFCNDFLNVGFREIDNFSKLSLGEN